MTHKQWLNIQTVLDDILAFPPKKRKLQLAKWFGEDEELFLIASRLVQLSESGSLQSELPPEIFGWLPLRVFSSSSTSQEFLVMRADDDKHPMGILHLGTTAFEEGSDIQEFREELKRVDSLNAEGFCSILDAGLDDFNHPFIVNEFVFGSPLLEASRDLNTRAIVQAFQHLLVQLGPAHLRGIPHGFFHPRNVLLSKNESILIPGYAVERNLAIALSGANLSPHSGLTPAEILYCAPERLLGQPATLSGDIYSLGVILYQMLSGAVPFGNRDESIDDLKKLILEQAPLEIQGLDSKLNEIVLKAIAKDPSNRYRDIVDFANSLSDFLAGLHLQQAVKAESPKMPPLPKAIFQLGRQHRIAAAIGLTVLSAFTFAAVKFGGNSVQANVAQYSTSPATPIAPKPLEQTPAQAAFSRINSLAEGSNNNPELQRSLNRVYQNLSTTLWENKGSDLNNSKLAMEAGSRAYNLSVVQLERARSSRKITDAVALEYALSSRKWIHLLQLNSDYRQAIKAAQDWQNRFSTISSSNIDVKRASALANTTLANLNYNARLGEAAGQFDIDFEKDQSGLLNAIRSLPGTNPGTEIKGFQWLDLAQSFVSLSESLESESKSPSATGILLDSRRLLEQASFRQPDNFEIRAALAHNLTHLAGLHLKSRSTKLALQDSTRASELLRSGTGSLNNTPELQRQRARAHSVRAAALAANKQFPEATQAQAEAISQWNLLERMTSLVPKDKLEISAIRSMVRG